LDDDNVTFGIDYQLQQFAKKKKQQQQLQLVIKISTSKRKSQRYNSKALDQHLNVYHPET